MTNHIKKKLAVIATLIVVFVSFITVALSILFNQPDPNCVCIKVISNGVDAVFGADFQDYGSEFVTRFFDERRNTILTFDEDEENVEKTFTSSKGTNFRETSYVLFRYYVANNASYDGSREGKGIKVTLVDNSTNRNVSIKYRVTDELVEDLVVEEEDREFFVDAPRVSYVAPWETKYYYVLVEKQGDDAEYFGGTNDSLTWILEKADAYEEDGWIINKENVVLGYGGEESETKVPWTANTIAPNALAGNTIVENLFIPASITDIGENAFADCPNLTSVTFEKGIKQYARLYPDASTNIGEGAFKNCPLLEEILLPKDMSVLRSFTFEGCNALQSIVLTEGLTTLQSNAFKDCESLSDIEFSKTITTFEEGVFVSCPALESVMFPKEITSVPTNMFSTCDNLQELVFVKGNYIYGICPDSEIASIATAQQNPFEQDYFVGNTHLYRVVVPEDVTEVPDGAFDGCSNLKFVSFLGEISSIGNNAFKDCSNLAQIELPYPQSLLNVGSKAFANSGLQSFCFEDENIVVANDAFSNCTSLTSISLQMYEQDTLDSGELVCNVPQIVFDTCTSLDRIKINIWFSDEEKDKGYYTFCGGFDGIALTYTFESLINPYLAGCETIIEACIPSYYDYWDYELNNDAFRDCINLEKAILPYKMTTVGAASFFGCSALTSVELSNWTRTIQTHAFYGCALLENIYLPDTLVAIKSYAFYGLTSLTELILPSAIERIEENAFAGCILLEYVKMPSDIEHLADNIFEECESLETIEYYE